MPPGSAPDTASVSPASAFVSVMVAEASVVLPISGSPMRVSVSAIATAVPFSVNVVR